jgi:hypothetical protein
MADEIVALSDLPYLKVLPRSAEVKARMSQQIAEEPSNPFVQFCPAIVSATQSFARADLERTALLAVEALWSYAGANGGKLPARLEDVKDTPVLDNPITGRPFEYRVDGDTATLADTQSQRPLTTLTCSVRIRKQ